jgi:hypothetical protein
MAPTSAKRAGLDASVSPYEAYHKKRPKLDNLHVFGSLCFVKRLDREQDKQEPARMAIWLGAEDQGHLVEYLDEKGNRTGKRGVRRDIQFTERMPPNQASKILVDTEYFDPNQLETLQNDKQAQQAKQQPHASVQAEPKPVIVPPQPVPHVLQKPPFPQLPVPQHQHGEIKHEPPPGNEEEDNDDEPETKQDGKQPPPSVEREKPSDAPFSRSGRLRSAPIRYVKDIGHLREPRNAPSESNSSITEPEFNTVTALNALTTIQAQFPLVELDLGDVFAHSTAIYPGPSLLDEPPDIKTALQRNEWEQAVQSELASMKENQVFEPVKVSPEVQQHLIQHKWLFKRKPTGKAKARLVAKGFAQQESLHYNPLQTASPVASITTFRLIFALTAFYSLKLASLDYSTAFLNAPLTDTLFMSAPEGYLAKYHPDLDESQYCVRLRRSLYGLRQSSYNWYRTFKLALESIGYKPTLDPCLFFKAIDGTVSLVCYHVDDILCAASPSIRESEVQKLASLFKCSEPVFDPTSFLHWDISYHEDGSIKISMSSYMERLKELDDLPNSFPSSTPFTHVLSPRSTAPAANKTEYQKIVGRINYIAYCCRPDVSYHASSLATYSSDPSINHLTAAVKTLRYLISTPDFGITYSPHDSQDASNALSAHSDSDWASCISTRKSQSGMIILFDNNIIDWSSRRQSIVATSSQEAELTSAMSATSNIIYLRDLLASFNITQHTTSLFIDNKGGVDSCLSITQPSAKHIAIRLAFIRDAIHRDILKVQFVPTQDQLADILTKPYAGIQFHKRREQIGII